MLSPVTSFAFRFRPFSKFSPPDSHPSQRIKPGSWIRKFFGSKLLRLYAHYDDVLRRFPRLYKVYRIFADGDSFVSVHSSMNKPLLLI